MFPHESLLLSILTFYLCNMSWFSMHNNFFWRTHNQYNEMLMNIHFIHISHNTHQSTSKEKARSFNFNIFFSKKINVPPSSKVLHYILLHSTINITHTPLSIKAKKIHKVFESSQMKHIPDFNWPRCITLIH